MVWSVEDYCREASEQLTDELVYERVDHNPFGRVTNLINEKRREPAVFVLPNVIKDTTDFLMKSESLGDIPEGALIGTMDVIGLCLHIPHEEGLKSLKEIIQELKGEIDLTECYVDEDDLIDLARLVLENNCFEFDDKIYWQKLGTAIGSKFDPAFANIFRSHVEQNMLKDCNLRPWVWWRFFDYVFFIWLCGKESY